MLKERNNLIKEQLKKIEIGIVKEQDISGNLAKNVFLGIGSNIGNRKNNVSKYFFLNKKNIFSFLIHKYIMKNAHPK